MASRLSCSEYSFPAVAGQHERIGIVRLLGFELVDVALFLHEDRHLVADPDGVASELARALADHDLRSPDLFYAAGSTFEEIAPNPRDAGLRAARRKGYLAALGVTAGLGIAGMTILPGVTWAGDPDGAWACCVEELGWRAEQAATSGVELRVEAHAGSIVALPELALRLLADLPGLRLTLDLSHFELQSIDPERAECLAVHAGHLHVRAAKPGAIQIAWQENETDFSRLLVALDAAGYAGAFCIEYVPMPKWRCDEIDVVTETLATKTAFEKLGVV